MDARDATRKNQWLPACQVAPEIFQEVMPRRHPCMDPFVETWHRQRLQHQARTAVSGLLSDVARTNVASIASRFGHDRLPRPRGIGGAPWDEEPWRKAWRGHVAKHLGHQEGVLGCDPSALPTSGTASVGGGQAVVRSAGPRRPRSRGALLGRRGGPRASPRGQAAVPPQRVEPRDRAPGSSRCAPQPPRLSPASPVGVGEAGAAWRRTPAWLDRG